MTHNAKATKTPEKHQQLDDIQVRFDAMHTILFNKATIDKVNLRPKTALPKEYN
jgi:hypothetical protein